ncbi:MAG TPA: Lrp/AsnC family transcriptional regulator [Flavisolibacter sp.]|nr:Lrp/AsnC family transcriptional regulator [Flavisolibacter sp.]
MAFSMDETDLKILSLLQPNSFLTNNELSKKIGMAPSAVLERVKKLEQKGIIEGYPTRIKPAALELNLLAYIFIKTSEGPGNTSVAKQLIKIPDVLELHHIAGEDCYLAKVRAKDPLALIHLMRGKFRNPNILSTKTTIVLETLKETNQLPIPKN